MAQKGAAELFFAAGVSKKRHSRHDDGGLRTVLFQLGERRLPLYSGASGALAAPSGAFVLRSSFFQMIQLAIGAAAACAGLGERPSTPRHTWPR